MPEGKDPCEFILSAGIERFGQILTGAVDVFEFKWNRLMENFGGNDTLVDKKAAIEEYLQTMATAIRAGKLAPVDRGLIASHVSKIIGLSSKEISAELGKRIARAHRTVGYSAESRQDEEIDWGEGLFAAAQREILEVLLNQPELFADVTEKVAVEQFDVPLLRQTASILFEIFSAQPNVSLSALLARTESVPVANTIVLLAQAGEQKGNFRHRLTGAVDTLCRCSQPTRPGQIETIEDQTEFLQDAYRNAAKENRRNLGMM